MTTSKKAAQERADKVTKAIVGEIDWADIPREISGFGGGYEEACRIMVTNGVRWLRENPDVELDDSGVRAMQDAMIKDVPGGPTGAMVGACTGHVLYINHSGLKAWRDEMQDTD